MVTFESTPDGVYRVFAELNQGAGGTPRVHWGDVKAKLRVMLDGCGAYSVRRFLLQVRIYIYITRLYAHVFGYLLYACASRPS